MINIGDLQTAKYWNKKKIKKCANSKRKQSIFV